MKILNNADVQAVSGASSLLITQRVSTEGVSEKCVNTLVQALSSKEAFTDEQLFIQVLTDCTFDELDLIDDRQDVAIPFKVELI